MIEHILSNIQSILIFACFLSILILVHEWGHFITAKKLGVNVQKFALGFGPQIFSKTYNGTEFCLCLIPLGGYVKMAGDERADCTGDPGEFYSKSPGRRALIIFNGPVTNIILAYVCLYFVFLLGFPDISSKVHDLQEGYPAQAAGLLPGDQIIAINQVKIRNWTDLQKNVRESSDPTLSLTYLREGQVYKTTITPQIEVMENLFKQKVETRVIGVTRGEEIQLFKYGPWEALVKSTQKMIETTVVLYKAIYYMATGMMSPKDTVAGPVGIFLIVKTMSALGFSSFLFILGVISLNLALFNLLPLVPLDGGHLFLLLIEKIRRKPLSDKTDEFIMKLGFSFIILLALFVFYVDFDNIGLFDKIKHLFS